MKSRAKAKEQAVELECAICLSERSSSDSTSLGCGCAFHTTCLIRYVRMRLGDRASLFLSLGPMLTRGILCPNTATRNCGQPEGYLFLRQEFQDLRNRSRSLALSEGEALREVDWTNICVWLFNESTDVDDRSRGVSPTTSTVVSPSSLVFPTHTPRRKQKSGTKKSKSTVNNGRRSKGNREATPPSSSSSKDHRRDPELEVEEETEELSLVEDDDARAEELFHSFVLAATRPCPDCGFRASHAHGHDCHHIQGCWQCNSHFCYRCLGSEKENVRDRGLASKCRCGYWSQFCSPFSTLKDVQQFLVCEPFPYDRRCGCVICSECRRGQPCPLCKSAQCAVCKGLLPPGPSSLDDVQRFIDEVRNSHAFRVSPLFAALREACESADLVSFLQLCSRPRHATSRIGTSSSQPTQSSLLEPLFECDDTQKTLLHFALSQATHSQCARKIASKLVELGADVRAVDSEGRTPASLCLSGLLSLYNQQRQFRVSYLDNEVQCQKDLLLAMLRTVPQNEAWTLCSLLLQAYPEDSALELIVSSFPGEIWRDVKGRSLLYYCLSKKRWLISSFLLSQSTFDDSLSPLGEEESEQIQIDRQISDQIETPSNSLSVNETIDGLPLLALISQAIVEKYTKQIFDLKRKLLEIAVLRWRQRDSCSRTVLHNLLYFFLDIASFFREDSTGREQTVRLPNQHADYRVDALSRRQLWRSQNEQEQRYMLNGTKNLIVSLALQMPHMTLRDASLCDEQGNSVLHLLAFASDQSMSIAEVFCIVLPHFPSLLWQPVNNVGQSVFHVLAASRCLKAMQVSLELLSGLLDPNHQPIALSTISILNWSSLPLPLLAFSQQDLSGRTPLHVFCEHEGDLEQQRKALLKVDQQYLSNQHQYDEFDRSNPVSRMGRDRASSADNIDSERMFDVIQFLFKATSVQSAEQWSKCIGICSHQGQTILHSMCVHGAELLLENFLQFATSRALDIPWTVRDSEGNTAAHVAVAFHRMAMATHIFSKCTDPIALRFLIGCKNNMGDTVFHIIAREQQSGYAILFVELVQKWKKCSSAVANVVDRPLRTANQTPQATARSLSSRAVILARLKAEQEARNRLSSAAMEVSSSLSDVLMLPATSSIVDILASSPSIMSLSLLERLIRDGDIQLPSRWTSRRSDLRTSLHLFLNNSLWHSSDAQLVHNDLKHVLMSRLVVSFGSLVDQDADGNAALHVLASNFDCDSICTCFERFFDSNEVLSLFNIKNKSQETFLSILFAAGAERLRFLASEPTATLPETSERWHASSVSYTSFGNRDDGFGRWSRRTACSEVESVQEENCSVASADSALHVNSIDSQLLRVIELLEMAVGTELPLPAAAVTCLAIAVQSQMPQSTEALFDLVLSSSDFVPQALRCEYKGVSLLSSLCVEKHLFPVLQRCLRTGALSLSRADLLVQFPIADSTEFDNSVDATIEQSAIAWACARNDHRRLVFFSFLMQNDSVNLFHIRNSLGQSIWHICAEQNDSDLLRVLLTAVRRYPLSFCFDDRDFNGCTVFEYAMASRNGDDSVADLLLDEQTNAFNREMGFFMSAEA